MHSVIFLYPYIAKSTGQNRSKKKTFFFVFDCYLPKLNENVGRVDKKRWQSEMKILTERKGERKTDMLTQTECK